MKKTVYGLTLALMVLALFAFVGVPGASAAVDGDYEFSRTDGKADIEKYLGAGGNVVIPETLSIGAQVYPVRSISSSAFENKSSLTSVTIPAGVTYIGSRAFGGCTNLASVVLPGALTQIGQGAFADTALTSIALPNGLKIIEKEAFTRAKLTSVCLPDSVTELGPFAFQDCASLQSAQLGTGLTQIVGYTFAGCASLKSVSFSSALEYIGIYAFDGCTSLSGVTLHEGLKTLDDYAFRNCTSLTSLSFPTTLTTMYYHPFQGCTNIGWVDVPGDAYKLSRAFYRDDGSSANITKVRVRAGATSICDGMFENCYNITDIDLPASITSVGANAFSSCFMLKSLQIPSRVTTIGNHAFYKCSALTELSIPSAVRTIGYAAFASCSNLTSLAIPASVTSFGGAMFNGCTKLSQVALPPSLGEIPDLTFGGCTSLTGVSLPSGVTSIGLSAFRKMGLTSISLPSGVKTVGDYAFADCASLTSVSMPGVQTLGKQVFAECVQLQQVSFAGSSFTELPAEAFSNCEALSAVTLPQTLTSIGSRAFYWCRSLTSISLPSGLKTIGTGAFNMCTKLADINVPGGVTSIGESAFFGTDISSFVWPKACPGLAPSVFEVSRIKTITLNNSVTDIGDRAFYGCGLLETITLPGSVRTIGTSGFQSCRSLTELTIPDGVTFIGHFAFAGCSFNRLSLPASVTTIDADAFAQSAKVMSLTLPGKFVLSSFLSATQLQQVQALAFAPGSGSIAANACKGMTSLTSVDIPVSVASVGAGAFSGISSIAKVTAPGSLVMSGVFPGSYASLKEIRIAAGTTAIAANAFKDCAAIEAFTVPDGVSSIGASAFAGCAKLSSIIVPKSVSSIASTAFAGDANLKMYGYAYSYAETFAKANSIPFVLLDGGITLVVEGPATLQRGATAKYTAKRLDAQAGSYTWSSSVTAVATIDQGGNLTAVGGGETQILARDIDNPSLFATLRLSVSDPVTAVAVSPAGKEIQVGEVLGLSVALTPTNATNPTLTWSSSQPTLVSVDQTGKIKGLAIGSTRVTASADNGVTGYADITVIAPTSAIRVTTLDDQSVSADCEIEKTLQLRAVAYPANTPVDVSWASSNAASVSVSAAGLVKALKSGEATITATLKTDAQISHSIKIRVMVPVKEVKLSAATIELTLDESAELIASVLPQDATEPELTWLSSAPAVVSVSAEGKLTALGVGRATITATAKNKVFASCEITVPDPEGLGEGGSDPDDEGGSDGQTISIYSDQGASALLYPKQKLQLSATVAGVTWKSSKPSYVSVSQTGLITVKKPGKTVTITAKLGSATGSFKVRAVKPPKSIKIASAVAYTNGQGVQLKYTLSPKGASCRSVTWAVSGDAATINATGVLSGVSDGEVTVTITTDNGKTTSRVIKIRTLPSSISLSTSEANLKIKAKLRLTATLDGSEPAVTWKSSNKKLATVSAAGVVKGVKAGTVTITCTTKNGLTASCIVRVMKELPAPSPSALPPEPTLAPELASEPEPTPEPGQP